MKTHLHLFSIIFSLFFSLNTQAQTVPTWVPMKLAVAGGNSVSGVQASYTLDKCTTQDVVILKFANTNSYPVTIEWFDALFTTDLKWIKKEDVANKKTLDIPANSEIVGKCGTTENKNCVVVLNKLLPKVENLKQYNALHFTVLNK